nr:hypothetical protein BaRGS_005904 [Batillaria attramentaria]
MEASVYENYAFNSEEAHDQSGAEGEAPNKDGLVYTTIQFTENQLKKAEEEPPTRETTEYVSIDFTKHVPMVQD